MSGVDLRFYNSLTRQVERLQPKRPGTVRVYNCGPTVYKRQHIGNLRRYLFADFLRRTLEYFGLTVIDITNITDVGHLTEDELDRGEDKLERAARQEHLTPQEIATRETEQFFRDLAALQVLPASRYPRASEHIPDMQTLITRLIETGHAYQTPSGVYFAVESFPAYGQLSGNTLKDLVAGQRVAVLPDKRHPADFALWIANTKQAQRWPSPWGEGYPGWHIECSAMSLKYLGSDIDIHTGGEDNRFPHHENELAQSEAATGEPFVRLWLHNRHLQLSGQKLSKRAGEQITLDTLAERGFSPLAFRLYIFGIHYRSRADFSWEALGAARTQLETLTALLRRLHEAGGQWPAGAEGFEAGTSDAFGAALADDLNTPAALAVALEYVRSAHRRLDTQGASQADVAGILATLRRLDSVIGVAEQLWQEIAETVIPPAVTQLAAEREEARRAGDFQQADQLRTEIEKQGWRVEDTASGPRVYRLEDGSGTPTTQ